MFSQQGLPGFALQGCEAETAGLVVANDKLYEAVAQVAYAVEKDDIGTRIGHRVGAGDVRHAGSSQGRLFFGKPLSLTCGPGGKF